jgi:hypothetical protein
MSENQSQEHSASRSGDVELVSAVEQLSQSAASICERRFTEAGAKAQKGATNPYKPGSAAFTWWQRGYDSARSALSK